MYKVININVCMFILVGVLYVRAISANCFYVILRISIM